MVGERERLFAHVKAAKDWLGRAESSLEREEDVRGGLSLMLAEAELQRARETQRKKRFVQFLAPALALLLAAGAGLAWRAWEPSPEKGAAEAVAELSAGHPEPVRMTTIAAPPAPVPEPEASVPLEEPARSAPVHDAGAVLEEAAQARPTEGEATETKEAPPAREERAGRRAQEAKEPAAPPAEEMQKLMLSAGRVLRE